MIRALSLAAALAVLPLSSALAGDPENASEVAIQAAATAFNARMEAFGGRAEAVSADQHLTADQREARISVIWAEYAPEVQGAIRATPVMATSGAWASNDPEQQVTYGLNATYALDHASYAVAAAEADVQATADE